MSKGFAWTSVTPRTTDGAQLSERGLPSSLMVDSHVLVPDGRGYAQGTQRRARSRGARSRCRSRDADVVIEGDAVRVTEPSAVARIAQAWADNGWPAEPDGSGSGITAPFNAPSLGPPPWHVYRIEPRSATVVFGDGPGRPDPLPLLTLPEQDDCRARNAGLPSLSAPPLSGWCPPPPRQRVRDRRPRSSPALATVSLGKATLRSAATTRHADLEPDRIRVATLTIAGQVVAGTSVDPERIAERCWEAVASRRRRPGGAGGGQ